MNSMTTILIVEDDERIRSYIKTILPPAITVCWRPEMRALRWR